MKMNIGKIMTGLFRLAVYQIALKSQRSRAFLVVATSHLPPSSRPMKVKTLDISVCIPLQAVAALFYMPLTTYARPLQFTLYLITEWNRVDQEKNWGYQFHEHCIYSLNP